MADKIPVKGIFNGGGDSIGLGEFEPTDTVGISFGGTGATSQAAALLNLGAASAADLASLYAIVTPHVADTTIHFVINDSGINVDEVWSSFKINSELSNKSDVGHIHDDRYYTETEVDALISGFEDENVKVSGNDTTPGHLVDKLVAGQGVQSLAIQNPSGNETLQINNQVYVATIGSNPEVVYLDNTRAKILSAATLRYDFASPSVGKNDWLMVDAIAEANLGMIIPFNATIVHLTLFCDSSNGRGFNLWMDAVNYGNIITSAASGVSQLSVTTTNIDLTSGMKIRLESDANGAGNLQDVVLSVYVKWRV